MNITLAILQKISSQFAQAEAGRKDFSIAIAPFAHTMTNLDFKFLDPATKTTAAEAREFWDEEMEFATVANSIIRAANIWQIDSQALLYDEYRRILREARVIDPLSNTAAEQARIDAARQVLFGNGDEPTDKHKKYKKFAAENKELEEQIMQHEENRIQIDPADTVKMNRWNRDNETLQEKMSELQSNWEGIGFKTEIDRALQDLRLRSRKDDFLRQWREALNSKMGEEEERKSGNIPFFETSCLPNDIYRFNAPVWKKLTITQQEIPALVEQAKSKFPSALPDQFHDGPSEIAKISFELCILEIRRSWFDERLLTSPFWKFDDASEIVSGGLDSYEGSLPAYPVKLVLVKNVSFDLVPGSAQNEELKKNLQSGQHVFLGPFMLQHLAINQDIQHVNTIGTEKITPAQLNIIATASLAQPVTEAPAKTTRKSFILKNIGLLQKTDNKTRLNQNISKNIFMRKEMMSRVAAQPTMHTATFGTAKIAGGFKKASFLAKPHTLGLRKIRVPVEMTSPPPPPPVTAQPEPAFFQVSGTIFQARDSQPMAGAEVVLVKIATPAMQSFITGADGNYRLENIEKGAYHLTIRKTGFDTIEMDITVDGNQAISKIMQPTQEPTEQFHLLAVICKKLPKLPNPIPDAVYI